MPKLLDRLVDRVFEMPKPVSPHVEVTRNMPVPMPDGTVLLADRYRPDGAGPLPVVLLRNPYGSRRLMGWLFGTVLSRRGFQVVVQNVRGTFGSGGEFQAFHQEKDDGMATAAWLREQPWCDGRLAMAGASYLGYTQWAVGPYLDPPLAAMGLAITASEFASTFYPGGVLGLENMLSWSVLLGRQEEARFGGLLPDSKQARRTRQAMSHLPLREADVAAIGKRVPFFQEVVGHAEPGDRFWAGIDHTHTLAELAPPTSMVTGWYDLFLPAQLRDFAALSAAGRRTRVTIGPWCHRDTGTLRTLLTDQVSWLGTLLHGDTSEAERAPVRLHLQHADRWLELSQWPPAESVPTPIHLHPGGRLDWAEPAESGQDTFDYDPADPTPSVGGALLFGTAKQVKQQDNRDIEARPDVLTYTGDPVPHDLDLIGEVRARIHLRTDLGHADVFVRLCDVDPKGVSRNVCDGIVRLRPDAPAAGADGVVAADVEMFPTGYRFRRGHRMRIQIAGGAFPRFARNHGTGEPADAAVEFRRCRFEVFHDPAHPSQVVLPVFESRTE